MNKFKKFFFAITIVLTVALVFPYQVFAAPMEDDRIILGETYTLESGRTLNGNLIVLGGIVNIEEDAMVDGNIVVIGGLVTIDGTVTGNMVAIGGTVNLEENALIQGDLISPTSYVDIASGAVVQGDQIETWDFPWGDFNIPERINTVPVSPQIRLLSAANRVGRWIAFTLIMTGLGALLLLIMPKSVDVMTTALEKQPWLMLAFGALTAFVMLFGGLILSITICLIPIVILISLAFALAALVGWLTLGYELGKKISQSLFKTTWHPVLAAAVGNILLYLIASGLDLIPCLGGLLVFVAVLFGLGMVVVTLFGTNPYPRGTNINDEKQVVLFEGKQSEWEQEDIKEKSLSLQKEEERTEHPIEDLGLDQRINKTLKDAGLTSIEDVLERLEIGDESLLTINGFGIKSLEYLKEALYRSGYSVPGTEE